jgi:hypothetical protein
VTPENNSAIWSEGGGKLAMVAREGDPAPAAPAGVNFGTLNGPPVINALGRTAFHGWLARGIEGVSFDNDEGIWVERDSVLELVVREGSPAPGIPAAPLFDFQWAEPEIVLNASGRLALYARFQSRSGGVPDTISGGIWAEDITGTLQLIAYTGDVLEVAPGDFRTIAGLGFAGGWIDEAERSGSGNEDGRPSGFNDAGLVAFSARFTDGSTGVFVSSLATVPEPSSWLGLMLPAIFVGQTRVKCALR